MAFSKILLERLQPFVKNKCEIKNWKSATDQLSMISLIIEIRLNFVIITMVIY